MATNEVGEIPLGNAERISRPTTPLDPNEFRTQMIAKAMNLSLQRMEEGTASSAEVTFWLKEGSPKTQLELQNLEKQSNLLDEKITASQMQRKMEVDLDAAMKAFKGYQPTQDDGFDEINPNGSY